MTFTRTKTSVQRFWEKVGPHDDPNKCWLWLGNSPKGYGQFWDGAKRVKAHRFAYELLVGPIPEGLTLDHVKSRGCTSTLCVNPVHLEPVTIKVNLLRGCSPSSLNARKTHCKRGHKFTAQNTYNYGKGRIRKRKCCTCVDLQRGGHLKSHL